MCKLYGQRLNDAVTDGGQLLDSELAADAKKRGVKTVFNPMFSPGLWGANECRLAVNAFEDPHWPIDPMLERLNDPTLKPAIIQLIERRGSQGWRRFHSAYRRWQAIVAHDPASP